MIIAKSTFPIFPIITLALRQLQLANIMKKYKTDQAELMGFEFRYHQMISPLLANQKPFSKTVNSAYADPYLRSRYKEIARLIHPDKATNPEMEKKYTNIMATATAALYDKDVETLEKILAVLVDDLSPSSERKQIEHLEHQIYHYCVEQAQTRRSTMWRLMEKEKEFLNMGRNMLKELENQLRAQTQ